MNNQKKKNLKQTADSLKPTGNEFIYKEPNNL